VIRAARPVNAVEQHLGEVAPEPAKNDEFTSVNNSQP
jgi:hypothetical protein